MDIRYLHLRQLDAKYIIFCKSQVMIFRMNAVKGMHQKLYQSNIRREHYKQLLPLLKGVLVDWRRAERVNICPLLRCSQSSGLPSRCFSFSSSFIRSEVAISITMK
jgi:hypothetical protein